MASASQSTGESPAHRNFSNFFAFGISRPLRQYSTQYGVHGLVFHTQVGFETANLPIRFPGAESISPYTCPAQEERFLVIIILTHSNSVDLLRS